MLGGGVVLVVVVGGLGMGVFVWRGFYFILMDDIKMIYIIRKLQVVIVRDVVFCCFVIDMFEEIFWFYFEWVFIVFEDKNYMYVMVDVMVNRVVNVVVVWNFIVGEIVVIMVYNFFEFLWMFLGLLFYVLKDVKRVFLRKQ